MNSWDSYLSGVETKAKKLLTVNGAKETKSCRGVFEHAPNIIEWTIEPRFLNVPQVINKYVRQFQILRDVFQLYCPICNSMRPEAIDCWGKTRMELESQVLLQWNEGYQDDVCPKCHTTRQEFLSEGMLEPIDTLILSSGMRSGKSVGVGIMGTYIEHELSIIGDIHEQFEVLPGDPLQMSFIATTATQAMETIFVKYRALRTESPWFKKYVAWVKGKEKEQQTSLGMKKLAYTEETESQIYNGLIDLQIKSLNSNSAGLAGATRIAAFLDELSRFDGTESKRSASEVVKVMGQGLKTVRGARDRLKLRPWWGLFAAASSPISIDDQTMIMVRQKIKGQYNAHYATWDFNPDLPRSIFDPDFQRDPVGAARDFGASPPSAASPYVDNEARFRQAIDHALLPLIRFNPTEPEDKTGRKYVGATVAEHKFEPNYVHYLHFDAGASFDTFAGASAHGEYIDVLDPTTKQKSQKMITVYDWVLGVQPILGKTLDDKRTVWFKFVVDIIQDLIKNMKIGLVTFDRWSSESLIQDIRMLGVSTENRSIKTVDFMTFLGATYDGNVRLLPPRPDEPTDPRLKNPQEKAIYELLRLERSPDLAKIYNPKKGQVQGMNSDDIAQVIVGAHMNVQQSVVSISDSVSVKEVLRRENASSDAYYRKIQGGQGGTLARGRRY